MSVDTKGLSTDAIRCDFALSQIQAELNLVTSLGDNGIRVIVDCKTTVLVSSGLTFTTNTCSGGSRLD